MSPEPKTGWGTRLFDTFKRWSQYLYDWLLQKNPILRPLGKIKGLEFLVPPAEKTLIPIFEAVLAIPDLPEVTKRTIRIVKDYCERTEVPINELVGLMALKEVIAGYLSPVAVHSAYHMSAELADFLDDPGRYIADWVVDSLEYIIAECVFRFW